MVVCVVAGLQVATEQRKPSLHTQTLPWHVVFAGQAPLQVMELPQPSPIVPPQYWPPLESVQVSALQLASPLHTPLTVSQTSPVPQLVLQLRLPPQPSPIWPQ